ncbi:MAG TPA: lysylphosphatidylglycerol synthase domain-containing protein [Candidatus Hydrogenedentes bacterium]|nr:lysylphosphatidylglycerol synthase domain-containing protein [Candidatus Hydrogenedentota bacterium]
MKLLDFAKSHSRLLALVVLALVTVVGLASLFMGDWHASLAYWKGGTDTLAAAFGVQTLNVIYDMVVWLWLLRLFGIRVAPLRGVVIYLCGFAGLLLPLQLGRFVRSEALARMGVARFRQAAKAEVVILFFGGAGAVAACTGLGAYLFRPWLAPLVMAAVVAAFLLGADRLLRLFAKERLVLAEGFWRRPEVFAVALLVMAGWFINGFALYLVVRDLPGDFGLWQALFMAPASMLVGAVSGLPGGIGAIEGFLGVSLKFMRVPSGHLALAVGAFRLISLWLWIPIGWVALTSTGRMRAVGVQEDNDGGRK